MAGVLKIEIVESANNLHQKLQEATRPVQRSKIQILWWLKTNKAKSVTELSEWSGYHRTCISRWLSRYRREGLSAMLAIKKSTGRPSVMTREIKNKLVSKLNTEEGFSSYKEIQVWLAKECQLNLEYKTVHKIVRYDLKAKLKRPRPVSVKQEKGAVETFKKTLPS